ncbi:MAG: sugar kinase [Tabrizicola flagellatus]|uniref:sugar kinase n=1 Tax=Tabrizicola flagellatus TaxID=2593021 RepID=UPI00391C233B
MQLGRIACLGEVMIEVARTGDDAARIGVAGDTFNTAVYLSRALGPGRVAYVTALGTDRQSDRILDALRAEALDTSHVDRLPGLMPGLYLIDTDARGERSFSYWRSTSAARHMFSKESGLTPEFLDGFDTLYLSGISIAILDPAARDRLADGLERFRARGGKVAFDSNYRAILWPDIATARTQMARFIAASDIAFPSQDDEAALSGTGGVTSILDRYAAAGVRQGALKCGADGAIALDGSRLHRPARPGVRVVDTTAAGDSFNAGFLAQMDRGGDISECLAAAAGLAERVIAVRGAILPR